MVDAVRKSSHPYVADYMRTERDEAHAWLAFAERKNDEALGFYVPSRTNKTQKAREKSNCPREMLADMFLGMNRLAESLAEYEQSLKTDRNRFHGLYGAARSAELLQQSHTAAGYNAQLLKNCEAAPSERQELSHAKELSTMK